MELSLIPQPKQVNMREGKADIHIPEEYQIMEGMPQEAYQLDIMAEKVWIRGGSKAALAYGKATLEQIRTQCRKELPCVSITDEPAFEWRAFHIDCARHFIPLEELKKMVRMAALFKFNRFHWHFSDDQGWRIESKAFPRLHQIGAYRNGDYFGQYKKEGKEGGFYTREQVRELVSFCDAQGIEVVPEVDIPGHVTAILAAYPHLGCRGERLETAMKNGIFPDILCAGKEETYTFLERLLEDLLELFPGRYFHIGGDETPKIRWKECPICRRRMEDEGLSDVRELQGYLQNRVIALLKAHGRTAIVWNEAVLGGNLDVDAAVQLWTEEESGNLAKHMEKGGRIILSPMKNSYCDYPYGFISLKSVYELDIMPEGLKEIIKEAASQGKQMIMGTECLVWTEFIRDPERLEKLCWPRYTASAEVGWCGSDRPGFEDFSRRLHNLYLLFEKFGVEATSEEGWIPSEEETGRQLADFMKNFPAEDLAKIREAQSQV